MVSSSSPVLPGDPGRADSRGRFLLAAAVLALAAAAAMFTEVFNFDIFWHLAGGEWMLARGEVLGVDPFSVDPEPRWVNVHWAFQVIVAAVHGLGGFAALSVLKAALAAATMLVFALALRREVPAAWLIVCGLVCIAVIETRFRVRPEAFTLLFLTATIALVERVRRGGGIRSLWLLVPLTAAWVNLHGLYVLGPAVFWSAALGAQVDRRFRPAAAGNLAAPAALLPMAAATLACLASPWPVEAAAQPLLLWTRVSGQRAAFSLGVSEFLPTWQSPFYLVLGGAIVVPAAGACLLNVRRVPVGHVLWLAAFATMALLARRNVALTGPVCGYLLARHGGALWAPRHARRRPVRSWVLTVAAALLAIALAAGCATEWVFRMRGIHRRFGPGLYAPHYPVASARYLASLDAPGDVFCENWGDAGTFLYHSRPRRVYMDGRLEAHSLERYLRQGRLSEALRTSSGADTAPVHEDLRFFFVRSLSGEHLRALSQSRRFRLLFAEPAGALFVRTDSPDGGDVPAAPELSAIDRPLRLEASVARVDGWRVERRRWWRQNPPSPHYRLGSMLLWLGWQGGSAPAGGDGLLARRLLNLSIRHLEAAATDGVTDRRIALGMLAEACQHRALAEGVTPTPSVPLDFFSARALCLYGRLDLADLADENMRLFAEQHVQALLRARRLDAAESAATELLHRAPVGLAALKRREYETMRATIAERVRLHQERAASISDPYPARAWALAGPDLGLAEQAVAELRTAPKTPENLLALADLLLNAGRPAAARDTCLRIGSMGGREGERERRLRWADRIAQPQALLTEPPQPPPAGDLARYYDALIWEQYGYAERALACLRDVVPPDEQLGRLVRQVRRAVTLAPGR